MNKMNLAISMFSIMVISIIIVSFVTSNTNNQIMTSSVLGKASAQQQSLNSSLPMGAIPSWIKNVAKWWSENQTSDSDFLSAIQYLIDKNTIHTYQKSSSSSITSQNDTLSQLDDLQTRYDALQTRYNELLQQLQDVTEKQQLSNSDTHTGTISAVAVYPVVQSDGFFQTTVLQWYNIEDHS